MTADIVLDALTMAWFRRKPGAGVLLHSDRGSQYASQAMAAKHRPAHGRIRRPLAARRPPHARPPHAQPAPAPIADTRMQLSHRRRLEGRARPILASWVVR
jgi:hypothetical protein